MEEAKQPDPPAAEAPPSIPKEEAAVKKEEDTNNNDRNKWDFTNRKVMVKNTLKFVDKKRLQKMIASWIEGIDVQVHKTKKPPKDNWVVLTLCHEDQVPIFIEHVNNGDFLNKKGERVHAVKVEDCDTHNKKRQRDGDDDQLTKRQRSQRQVQAFVPRVTTQDELKDKMIPLWRKTYNEQLESKTKELVKKCAMKVIKELKDKFQQLNRDAKRNGTRKTIELYDWLTNKRAIEVEPIIHAKDIVRNKCEFTFGYRYVEDNDETPAVKTEDKPTEDATKQSTDDKAETTTTAAAKPEETTDKDAPMEDAIKEASTPPLRKLPSVGSMARGWAGGVSHPSCCRNIPSEASALVDMVETFLKDCPMPPYDPKTHQGFWRTMTIRSSRRTNQCMLIFVHAPVTGGAGSKDSDTVDNYSVEVFESEKARLVSMLTDKDLSVVPVSLEEDNTTTEPQSPLRVTSIFFQEFDGISMPGPEHPVQHAYGATSIQEQLGKCTFQISPGAFFQVQTQTAETLYNVVVEKVREVTDQPEETLCFDVCCGTGTIGLTLLKEGVVGKVVGVDISAPAIEDAKINAQLNGFEDDSKTRFVAARAEHVMGEELKRVKGRKGKIVAVVDPARDGLHRNVLSSIRGFPQIDRVVYVSCNPTGSLVPDAVTLCMPPTKRYRGRPFKPTFAQPVDMFPYSNHCEMVMVFDRMTDAELGEGEEEEKKAASEEKQEDS